MQQVVLSWFFQHFWVHDQRHLSGGSGADTRPCALGYDDDAFYLFFHGRNKTEQQRKLQEQVFLKTNKTKMRFQLSDQIPKRQTFAEIQRSRFFADDQILQTV